MKTCKKCLDYIPDHSGDICSSCAWRMKLEHEAQHKTMNNENPDDFEPDVSKTDNILEEDGLQEPDPENR